MGVHSTFVDKAIRLLSVADAERMVEAGVLGEKERVELLDGVLVKMSPKGIKHENVKIALNLWFGEYKPVDIIYAPETTFRLDEYTYLEPDFVFYNKTTHLRDLSGLTSLLVIEVSDTSVGYDLADKPRYYARYGVLEYWVIDLKRDRLVVHRDGDGERYQSIAEHKFTVPVTPLLLPGMSVQLSMIIDA
jgi:Uma2 family endonuclease